MLFHVISQEEIILGHLAAHDIQTVIVGAADHIAVKLIMFGQVKILDFDRDGGSFMFEEKVILC